jgi:hypothetical protein
MPLFKMVSLHVAPLLTSCCCFLLSQYWSRVSSQVVFVQDVGIGVLEPRTRTDSKTSSPARNVEIEFASFHAIA